MNRITQQGLELQGDGLTRARNRIAATGHSSVDAFIQAQPVASLAQLVDELNATDSDDDPLPISVHHLRVLWRESVSRLGPEVIKRMAKRALVASLQELLPTGWPVEMTDDASFSIARAVSQWISTIGDEWRENAREVSKALRGSKPPPGWLPQSLDDEVLTRAFAVWPM